ncbi:DUF1636 domain-containing protein [Pantanalinema sp. GBBB05]|uniref:DUF1636 domain-containing protein n=1 Tax=Pantanalinema sp. GBBB05 TaxID=2604139 RepID=UPI001D2E1D83|nr:DUF1636 domain-containing protein [Pantanalinema sp. GBBB05]
MTSDTLFVCVLCQASPSELEPEGLSAGQSLFNHLQEKLESGEGDKRIHLQPVRCMGACANSCVAAFTAPHKLTFILSQLSPTHSVPELLQFSQQYAACPDGKVPYKERPEAVKRGIYAVLPPLPMSESSQ